MVFGVGGSWLFADQRVPVFSTVLETSRGESGLKNQIIAIGLLRGLYWTLWNGPKIRFEEHIALL